MPTIAVSTDVTSAAPPTTAKTDPVRFAQPYDIENAVLSALHSAEPFSFEPYMSSIGSTTRLVGYTDRWQPQHLNENAVGIT